MATKSSPAKKSAPKKVEPVQETNKPSVKSEKTKHNVDAAAVIGAIFLLLISLFIFKKLFVAASVNGEPISRFAVYSALEKQAGKQTLDNMITKALIVQEAKKRNINVSQADINTEVDKINKTLTAQGTTLDKALAAQGMTRNQLFDEIKIQLMVKRMVGDIKVSDKDVQDFITANKSQFPEGTTEAEMKTQAMTQLNQQKAQVATQKLIQQLKDNSKTIYFVKY